MKRLMSLIALVSLTSSLMAEESLLLYLRQPPEAVLHRARNSVSAREVVTSVGTYVAQRPPHKLMEKQMQGTLSREDLPNVSGFLTLYGGDSDISDEDGRLRFTLRHAQPKLQLVVTKHIKFELIKGETVSHTELMVEDGAPVKVYNLERRESGQEKDGEESRDENSEAGGLTYWHVEEGELAADNRIAPTALVVMTNPMNLYVPLGDVLTPKSPHLVLPSVYVTGRVENDTTIVQAMDILRFMDPVDDAVKKVDKKHTQLQIRE